MSDSGKSQQNKEVTSLGRGSSGFLRSAAAMSLGTLSSRVLGLVRDVLLTALFPRMVTDAFIVAFRLPNMFRRLLGEGALSASFIPVYVESLHHQPAEQADQRSRALASSVFTALTALTSTLSVLGVVFMGPLMEWWLSGKGYQSIPGKVELTVSLARIMFVYLFLVTSYAFLMAVSQAHKRFLIPALAPAVFNVCVIVSALLPQVWWHLPGGFLAVGVVVGGVFQVAMVAVLLVKLQRMPSWRFRWRTPGFVVVLRNTIPGLVGMGILQIMNLVNVAYASRLPQGSHSYIYLADRVLELPQSLVAISLSTAILPTLSEYWSRGEKRAMWEAAHKNIRFLLFLVLPSALGMLVLAQPIVEVLFLRGEFKPSEAIVTAQIVQVYSVLLIASGVNRVTIPGFYAVKNTWLPALVSSLSVGLHIAMAPWLMQRYGLLGLVSSTAISAIVNVSLITMFYRLMIGPLWLLRLIAFVSRLAPALLAMVLAAHYSYQGVLWSVNFLPMALARTVALAVAILFAVSIYFVVNALFKVQENSQVLGIIRRRF